jgi:hypothetical protein
MPTLNMPSLNEIILQLDALAGQISTTLLALGPTIWTAHSIERCGDCRNDWCRRRAALIELGDDDSQSRVVCSTTRRDGAADGDDGSLATHICRELHDDESRVFQIQRTSRRFDRRPWIQTVGARRSRSRR